MLLRYVIHRILIAVPVLLLISFIVFMVIQLPEGSFLDSLINQMKREGRYDPVEVEQLRERYRFDDPLPAQYGVWLWNFVTLDLGDSFETERPVKDTLVRVVPVTVAISAVTILFTWSIAVPFGVIAAVKKNTVFDYSLTFLGLTAMATPSFVVAIIFMVLMLKHDPTFDPTGLISREYLEASWLHWPKIADLLKHLWIPVTILGIGGTAGMIRILRANLIDELKKQYVLAARARGLHPALVVLRYPFRVAINPFMSNIGQVLPQIISGSMIVSIVLNLPTLGPYVLRAIQSQDTYMATDCIFIQCILAVVGILVSDIMLSLVDPRIKFGSR